MQPESQQGTMTRSERRRELTRRKLLEAGKLLIAQRGVAGLRIQDITEHADVALGSFYNHFATKEDLVAEVVTQSLDELASTTLDTVPDGADAAEVVAMSCLRVIRLADDEPDFARLVVNLANADVLFGAAIQPYARAVIERGITIGRFTVADLDVTLTAIIGGALALIREMLEDRHAPDASLSYARYVLGGLGLTPTEAASVADAVAHQPAATASLHSKS
ncbi:MAG TPA: TetR/AcrR family transcriptional regulator [Pseudonocardia sp.]|nr:TetR/AcrR family transcriptional regulator [Pseudonocardia sp.]